MRTSDDWFVGMWDYVRCQETFRWIWQAKHTHNSYARRRRRRRTSQSHRSSLNSFCWHFGWARKIFFPSVIFRIRKLISDTKEKKICGFITIYAVTLFVSLWKLSKHISGGGSDSCCCCCCYLYCWCYSLVDWTQFNLFICNA